MSRTSKCRELPQSDASSSSAGPSRLSDKALLRKLKWLCEQPVEQSYKRKLEAITLLLQRTDKRQVENQAQASLRTVQRWACRARQYGPEILGRRVHSYSSHSTSRLSDEQRARLAIELQQDSADLKRTQSHWSAALLRAHIRDNYGVRFSLRHCRRLLIAFGTVKRPRVSLPTQRRQGEELRSEEHRESRSPTQPIGDHEHKLRSLARIKRLAIAGLPLQPFAYTLFDLIHDAVPNDHLNPGLTLETDAGATWITRNFDYSRWFSLMQKYVLEATPEISGFNPPALLPWNPSTVLCHEQMARPDYHRSEGYNEFFRPMGAHHGLLTVLRDEQKRFLGYYPVFRSEKMKPFGRDDFAFFKAAAGHIAYGVRTSALITQIVTVTDGHFEQFHQVAHGIILTDRDGKVLSLNSVACSIFRQFALYDGRGPQATGNSSVETLTRCITNQLRSIFGNYETAAEAGVPLVKLYSHRSGATLRLRGYASNLGNGEFFTVLIELGETEDLLRKRLAVRYSLSARQADLLMLLRRSANKLRMASLLGLSSSSLKASLRELRLKLDLPDLAALRQFAAALASDI